MVPASLPPVIFLMGPTASGKTDAALAIVERFPCEIVSVDSALVYRGMDIGTAKPGPEVLARAPHRLIDICDPGEPYSAARFRDDALGEIDAILRLGRVPLLVGGTMLYFRALERGLSRLPGADPAVRAALEADARAIGWPGMHRRLAAIDPGSAARIHPNDPQRIQRALEVYEITGKNMSELCSPGDRSGPRFRPLKIALQFSDRALLHARIEARFHRMMDLGFLEEVRGLYRRGDLNAEMPSMRAVGYRQLWAYLAQGGVLTEAVQKGIIATRQLAKRQLTWLRAEAGVTPFEAGDRSVTAKVLKYLSSNLI